MIQCIRDSSKWPVAAQRPFLHLGRNKDLGLIHKRQERTFSDAKLRGKLFCLTW